MFPAATTLVSGQVATLSATVLQGNTTITGVPVGYSSSNATLLAPVQQGINQATITAPATGSGSVLITAKTPNGISASGTVAWAPRAVAIVKVSGDGQDVPVGTAAPLSLVVEVRDAQAAPVPGVAVDFAVGSGPSGTSVNPTSTATDPQGRAQTTLTAGSTAGPITVTATSTGLSGSPITFAATATAGGPGSPASVTVNSSVTQNATVNTAVGSRPSVLVRDANSVPVPGIGVAFSVQAANGSITGGSQVTDASGIATVGSWTLPQATGGYTMTATVASLTPVSFTATAGPDNPAAVVKISGDAQTGPAGVALANPLVLEVQDQFANVVPAAMVTWASPGGGSFAPTGGPTGANGRAQSVWTLGPSAPSQTATATVGALTPASFTATATFGPAPIALTFVAVPDVGVGKSATVRATIPTPAPVGGVAVTLTSDAAGTVSVTAPATRTILQGATTVDFTVNGLVIGSTTLRANATGFTEGTLGITVQDRSISVPGTLNVPLGQTASLPINIGSPAPAGGVVIAVSSDNPAAVGIQTPSVTIAQGQTSNNAVVQGLLPGTANVTVSNPAFDTDVSVVTTSASLNVVQGNTSLNQSFPIDIDIQLTSAGSGIAAPAGGVSVTLIARNPACVATNSPRTISSGLVATTATLSAGTGPFSCSTYVVATAPNIQPDSVLATVNPAPGINVSGILPLGAGLQANRGASLGASNHPGVTVRVESTDPTRVLIAPNPTSQGSAFLDIPMAPNAASFNWVAQGLAGQTGNVPVTISAPGFVTATSTDSLVAPALDIIFLTTGTTSFSTNSAFQIRTGLPNFNGQGIPISMAVEQAIRAGAAPLDVTLVNDTIPVADLATRDSTRDVVSIQIQPGQARSPSGASNQGVEFDPTGPGITTVSASAPGFISVQVNGTLGSKYPVTVTAPGINLGGAISVGGGLQAGSGGSLAAGNHGGITVHLVSSDATKVLLAPDAQSAGGPTLDINLLNGATSFSYVVQGLEGQTGPVTITASAPGFTGATQAITAVASALDIIFLGSSTTSFSPNSAFQVRVGTPNGQLTAMATEQALRAGGPGLTLTVAKPPSPAARLVTTALTGDTVSVSIAPGSARSPSPATAGGVEFDPLAAGTATVNGFASGFFSLPTASVTVTVTGQGINMPGAQQLGSGLQFGTGGSLGATQHGGVIVHIESSDPTKLLIARAANTLGQASIDTFIANGGTGFSYTVQALEGQTGAVTVTASAPGFSDGSNLVTLQQPALDIIFLGTSTTTFSSNSLFQVRIGIPNGQLTAMAAEQVLRFGSAGVTASLNSTVPGVGALVSSAGSSGTAQTSIAAQNARSPNGASNGGVEFDPILGGQTTVAATIPGYAALPTASVTVAVSSPPINISSGTTVGAGLQVGQGGSLGASNHGGKTVHIASSNPDIALVARLATDPGTASIDVNVPDGSASFSYVLQGVDTVTALTSVAITAQAPGFTDGSGTVSVTKPALDIIFLNGNTTTQQPNNAFQVRIGVPNAGNTAMAAEQLLRTGGTARVATVNNSNTPAGVGELAFQGGTAQSGTVGIQLNTARSPSGATNGGVEYHALAIGTSTVSATIPGFIALPTATQTVTVTTPNISVSPVTVGAGLQVGSFVSLGASQHGGVTVHVESNDPGRFLVARTTNTAGVPSFDTTLANGTASLSFVVAGVEGATGTADLTVSAPQFVTATVTETVVQPAADIIFLVSSISAGAANEAFQIRVGIPDANGNVIAAEQAIRAGGIGVTATVDNTNPSAAQLTINGGASGQSVQVGIAPTFARSPTGAGEVQFDPQAQGSTSVRVTIPGFKNPFPAGTVTVTVGP